MPLMYTIQYYLTNSLSVAYPTMLSESYSIGGMGQYPDYGNSVLGAPPPHCTVPLSVPVVVDLNMLMPAVADDATPIIKVPLPLRGIGRTL